MHLDYLPDAHTQIVQNWACMPSVRVHTHTLFSKYIPKLRVKRRMRRSKREKNVCLRWEWCNSWPGSVRGFCKPHTHADTESVPVNPNNGRTAWAYLWLPPNANLPRNLPGSPPARAAERGGVHVARRHPIASWGRSLSWATSCVESSKYTPKTAKQITPDHVA